MRHRLWAVAGGAAALTLLTATGAHAEGEGDIRVTKTVVNKGGNVIVGTARVIDYPVAITIKDDSGVKGLTDVSTYSFSHHEGGGFAEWVGSSCVKKSSTTSVCTATMRITPEWIPGYSDADSNKSAGKWQVNATVKANDGDYWISDAIAAYKVKRAAQLTTDATPEPVAKGAQLTVKGKLSRANWEDLKYHGYPGQSVRLQFRAAGAAHYRTVKTVKTDNVGRLSTKVTATAAGSWRWYFPGTTTTSLKASAGDAVKLR